MPTKAEPVSYTHLLRMVLRVLTLMRNAIEQIEPFERSVFQIIAG